MKRTSLYIIFFVVILIFIAIIEPSGKRGILFAVIMTLFKYLDTFLHELGHFLAGKLMGYEIEKVVIGDRKQVFRFKVFGTAFIFCFGFGGLTVIGSGVKNSKLRLSAFALGGIIFQTVVISIVYILFGIGSEENYFIPLIFMIFNLKTILSNLYPRTFIRNGRQYLSDGLLLKRILKMEEMESK